MCRQNESISIGTMVGVVATSFPVVSSLDSMILGENQIVSQVRSAFQCAEQSSSLDPSCDAFLKVLLLPRKSNGNKYQGAVSIGRAGVDLSRQVLGDISNKTAMIIGAENTVS